MAKKNTIGVCEALARPILEGMGLFLWDVRFEKEGSIWFLRYLIDKEGGVDINDCERFSRAVDPVLDQMDPIEQTYCLEVSSPGIERELCRPWHFERYLGKQVIVRFIRPKDGVRELVGPLVSHADGVTVVQGEGGPVEVVKSEAASIRLVDDYDYSKE